jgi:hypothetical protein
MLILIDFQQQKVHEIIQFPLKQEGKDKGTDNIQLQEGS